MRKVLLVMVLLAAAAAPALAQDEATARKGLDAFLRDALGPDDKLDRIERDPEMDPLYPGTCSFTRWGELTAAVDSRSGRVVFFSRFKPLLWIRTKDHAAEIARRAKFSLDEDEKRARAFLGAHYPAFEERVFELVGRQRLDHGALVQDEFVFGERPAKGVTACWPNRLAVSVNPETGAIVTYAVDDRRVESKTKPRLDAATARKAVLDEHGKKLSAENRDWLAKEAPVLLVAVEGEKGEGRTAWLVAGRFVVDAETGTVRVLGRK